MSSLALFADLLLIRRFEERALALFDQGLLRGTTHPCIGQEANAVGVLRALGDDVPVLSPHRCHGHFLARTRRPDLLFAELLGRALGASGGRGGSQHLIAEGFLSHGILGGTLPIALGMALAEQRRRPDALAVAFLGDGTLGEGVVYETLNLAALWGAPLLLVLEHNGWAQSTPTRQQLAGSVAARAAAFGVECSQLDTSDVEIILAHTAEIARAIQAAPRPHLLHIETCRMCDHSRRDDLRPPEEIARARARDPLPLLAARLAPDEVARAEQEVAALIEQALEAALASPPATLPAAPWGAP